VSVLWSTLSPELSAYEQFGFEALEVAEGQSQARPAATAMFLSLREIAAEIE
jgi:hypothetical protein